MATFLRFTVFALLLVALVVFLVVPLVVGPILTSMVRQAGLEGDDVTVSVDLLGPAILSGRAEGLRVRATDVRVPRAVIDSLDVTLHGVSIFDRSFRTVRGTLAGLEVQGPEGEPVHVASVDLDGPADAALARGRLDAPEAERLIRRAIEDAGVTVDDVWLRDDSVRVSLGDNWAEGRLRVAGGSLVLENDLTEPLLLLTPAPSEPWRLDAVRVEPTALTLDLILDTRSFWAQVSGA